MGHTTTKMTAEVYRHPVTPTVNVGRRPMEQMFDARARPTPASTVGSRFWFRAVLGQRDRTWESKMPLTWHFRVGRAGLEPTTPCASCTL